MIVPVYLSHQDRPESEVLVYALLDTQSDTTFIHDDICDELGLEGSKTKLLLSTMFAENKAIECKCLTGLQVRGHDSQEIVPLPTTYSRNIIPANRSHIPTPEMADKWSHLKPIVNKLMPLGSCKVGLLIGYNCPRALAPKDVILPTGNEPYAQRTDLGWSIVGIVDSSAIECDERDPFGVSHRIIAHGIPPALWTKTEDNEAQDTPERVLFAFKSRVKELVTPKEVIQMMELDFIERKADQDTLSQDDRMFLSKIKEGIHIRDDGHYEMPLPFKGPDPAFLSNKTMALQRLKQLKYRLRKDTKYRKDYSTFMSNVIQAGFAERVPPSELERKDGKAWYIPHHGVYHPKKPDKIRIVFDCSAEFKGESLNDHLLKGPDLTNTLIGVLSRFRQEPVAFMCDVEQMFHQFKVNVEHRDYLRFLWWENEDYDRNPTEYRMNVHLFGASSSPGCANYGLKQTATDNEEEFGSDAANFIRQDFYVDDGLKSVSTAERAIKLIANGKEICAKGGMRLHKIISNSRAVMDTIPPDDRAKEAKDLDFLNDDLPIERALGVQWCVESDTFKFRITLKDKPLTRRGILSTVSSVYDPLGFLAPFLMVGKQILQETCKDQLDWDSPLPEALRPRWERWKSELPLLEAFKIDRCFKPKDFGEVRTAELHHFSDASTVGYGQCSYLRLVNDRQQVHCALVMGKARVAPLKQVTIPRLELTAAVVSLKISALIRRELDYQITKEVFWTDSKVVLGYIANDSKRFHVFVANRVQQIRDQTEPNQWLYVRTDKNPADHASRGLSVQELLDQSMWLKGPDFLWKYEIPTMDHENMPQLIPNDPEVKKVRSLASHVQERPSDTILGRLERFSDWYRAKRAIAACLKLKAKMVSKTQTRQLRPRSNTKSKAYEPVKVDQICEAEMIIIRLVQKEAFKDELSVLHTLQVGEANSGRKVAKKRNNAMKQTSSLFRLDPYVDSDGLIRVGGRMRNADFPTGIKHPIILPRKHHVTDLVIRYCHEQVHHQGRGMTMNEIRANGFWIIGCGSAVSNHILQCVKCRKLRSSPQEQKMADLPEDRLEPAPPFTYCAVDFFGPWHIKDGRKELKRYGALFTCMASRSIHIETANSLDTDSFINALRRFMAVRGPIRQLRSDQGTNFVGAANELKCALNDLDENRVQQFLTAKRCDYFKFKMNVPSASHMGGVWERQIRTVRSVLASLMDQAGSQLDDESLRTLMCEAAAVVNSRPLTVDNLSDPTSLAPLTPNHLLTMKSSVVLQPPGQFESADNTLGSAGVGCNTWLMSSGHAGEMST